MESYAQPLITTLVRQTDVYGQLLRILHREQEALTVLDFEMLKQAAADKVDAVGACRRLETRWLELHAGLAEELGCHDAATPTFTELAAKLPPDEAAELWQAVSALLPLSQQIHEVNTTNHALLTHSVGMVHGAMSLLNNLKASLPVYNRAGQTQTLPQSGRFISGNI